MGQLGAVRSRVWGAVDLDGDDRAGVPTAGWFAYLSVALSPSVGNTAWAAMIFQPDWSSWAQVRV
jgi:hypothetical protein